MRHRESWTRHSHLEPAPCPPIRTHRTGYPNLDPVPYPPIDARTRTVQYPRPLPDAALNQTIRYLLSVRTQQGFWHPASVWFLDTAPAMHSGIGDKELVATVLSLTFLRGAGEFRADATSEAWMRGVMSPRDRDRVSVLARFVHKQWSETRPPKLPSSFHTDLIPVPRWCTARVLQPFVS